jgi:hypothetical protein
MPKVQYIDMLSREEYEKLKDLADIEGISLEDFIRQSIRNLLRRKPRPIDFTKDPSFGIWKEVSKTDEELLNELGGNWENFPPNFFFS